MRADFSLLIYNEGIEKGENKMIIKLIQKKMSYEDISDISGKTINEIKKIEKSVQ